MTTAREDAPRFTNIAQITAANTEAGYFWFSTNTKTFFRPKVESRIYDGGTSSDYPEGCRLWVESTRDGTDQGREYKISRFDVESADITYVSVDYRTLRFGTKSDAERFLTDNLL